MALNSRISGSHAGCLHGRLPTTPADVEAARHGLESLPGQPLGRDGRLNQLHHARWMAHGAATCGRVRLRNPFKITCGALARDWCETGVH